MRQSLTLAAVAALVLLAGLLVYLPGLSGPLLFDDKPALTANEAAKISGGSFDQWRAAALSSNSGILRRPISMLSFAANHALAGSFSPAGLKAVNISIHCACAVLLYFLFLLVLEALGIGRERHFRQLIALAAAGAWLLHPLHVSTVLYVVQRMAQMSTFFVLAGLVVFMVYRRRWAEAGAEFGELLAAALWLLLLTVLAVLSKENGALLPWFIVVLEVGIFRGVWAGRCNRVLRVSGWMSLALPVLLVLAILSLSPELLTSRYASREFTLEERLLTQSRLLWQYLGWLLVPRVDAMGFQHDDIPISTGLLDPVTTLLALAAWAAGLLLAFRYRRRYPLLLLALLFYLVGHSMESSVYPLEMVYEHRNYLPSGMVALAVAALLLGPVERNPRINAWYAVAGVLVVLLALLFTRVQAWSDELTLARTDAMSHPDSARSNYFYASALLRRYEQRTALGIGEQEAADTLVLSRHYFERMYQANNDDIAALVMLYYLDSLFFPQLQEQVDWWDKLDAVLATKTLQASDWNAFTTLVDCLEAGVCKASRSQVLRQFDVLSRRYPRSVQVMRHRYRYLSGMGADSAELLPILQQAQVLSPGSAWIYADLLNEYQRTGDVAQMYEYARRWLLNDRGRYSLPLIKGLFRETDADPVAAYD